MRPKRGSVGATVAAGGAIGGTQRPNPTSGSGIDCDADGNDRPSGGVTGAHENRREYGAETLKARCWCQRQIVDVPSEVIRRTETLSCGQPQCAKDI